MPEPHFNIPQQEPFQPEKIANITNAIVHIQAKMQECSVMGANDYEMPALERLIQQVQTKRISPWEAIMQADGIRDSKQDYH